MFYLLIACLALSALLTINAIVSLLIEMFWRAIKGVARRWPARARAQALFTLRVFPLAAAFLGVAALIIPSYLTYEPRPPDEVVTTKLAALTLLSTVGIGLAVRRGFVSWRATRRLVDDWLRHAEAVRLQGAPIPAYRIRHSFPVIAVVGVSRPRLFIASQIFDSLSHDEIAAAIRHEAGHLAMRDNFKRSLMRVCRDALMIAPCGRSIDRDWDEATEDAADEHAARAGAAVALDLASALIKIARLIPPGARPTMPAGAFLIDDDVDGVAWRVRQLTRLAEINEGVEGRAATALRLALWISPCVFVAGVACAAASPAAMAKLHAGLEHVFRFLS